MNEKDFSIEEVMSKVQELRSGFISECDFQFIMGVAIRDLYKIDDIVMEYKYPDEAIKNNERQYIDILVIMNNKYYPIELKYKHKCNNIEITKNLNYDLSDETCTTDHRKKYFEDIDRLSKLSNVKIQKFNFAKGYAILLTNYKQFREEKSKKQQVYSLDQNKINNIKMKINKKCENIICDMKWYDYRDSNEFSYLITTINKK